MGEVDAIALEVQAARSAIKAWGRGGLRLEDDSEVYKMPKGSTFTLVSTHHHRHHHLLFSSPPPSIS